MNFSLENLQLFPALLRVGDVGKIFQASLEDFGHEEGRRYREKC